MDVVLLLLVACRSPGFAQAVDAALRSAILRTDDLILQQSGLDQGGSTGTMAFIFGKR